MGRSAAGVGAAAQVAGTAFMNPAGMTRLDKNQRSGSGSVAYVAHAFDLMILFFDGSLFCCSGLV